MDSATATAIVVIRDAIAELTNEVRQLRELLAVVIVVPENPDTYGKIFTCPVNAEGYPIG